MEIVGDDLFKKQIPEENLRYKENAYVKGRLVENALRQYVIKRNPIIGKTTFAVFADVEGLLTI